MVFSFRFISVIAWIIHNNEACVHHPEFRKNKRLERRWEKIGKREREKKNVSAHCTWLFHISYLTSELCGVHFVKDFRLLGLSLTFHVSHNNIYFLFFCLVLCYHASFKLVLQILQFYSDLCWLNGGNKKSCKFYSCGPLLVMSSFLDFIFIRLTGAERSNTTLQHRTVQTETEWLDLISIEL